MENKSLKFFKKNLVIAQFKALNERISECDNFLKLEPHFSVPKKSVTVDKS